MGIFDSIMHKLGFGDEAKEEAAGKVNVAKEVEAAMVEPATEQAETAASEAIAVIDVVGKMEALAASHAEDLNWKESIVDLMKLLGLDSSYSHRKELARELDCPDALMGDSAKMNVWLHKTVMVKLAENGGAVPQDLLA